MHHVYLNLVPKPYWICMRSVSEPIYHTANSPDLSLVTASSDELHYCVLFVTARRTAWPSELICCKRGHSFHCPTVIRIQPRQQSSNRLCTHGTQALCLLLHKHTNTIHMHPNTHTHKEKCLLIFTILVTDR